MDHNAIKLQIQADISNKKFSLAKNDSSITLSGIFGHYRFQNIISECREYRDRVYSPQKTLLMFTKQVLQPDKSCKNAVSSMIAGQLRDAQEPSSLSTGPYCKARTRLPEQAIYQLVKETASLSLESAPQEWKWQGHHVKLVDGTTIRVPDTDANYYEFGTGKNGQGEAGCPILRLVTIISLSIGSVIDYAAGKLEGKGSGEHSLLRNILSSVHENDILLGDRYYPSFYLLSDLQRQNAHGVFEAMPFRTYDFRKGVSLGKKDHIVEWSRPGCSSGLDGEVRKTYPKKIQVREFKYHGKTYVTTFLDSKKYPKKALAELYKNRWKIELNLRDIKSTMSMATLSCKTPDMVRKELGVHLLAYNLIRVLIIQSCIRKGGMPVSVSFKGTIQLLNQFMPYFCCLGKNARKIMFDEMINMIVQNRVNNRPGRSEPRVVRNRPSSKYPALNSSRMQRKRARFEQAH